MIIVQKNAFPTEFLHQHLDPGILKVDDSLLMPIDPAGQNHDQ